jgi:SAM-dependent methyltransferase
MDLPAYRERSHATWETMAPSWFRRREWMWDVMQPVSERLVEKLDPQPGQTILELAAGVGDTGFAAAPRLGEDGKLISTDFAPQMVEAARERAAELGLANVEHRVMDAERMDLPDDSVDGVLCRFGYMAVADPALAFAETRRVLRPGGRLCFAVWGPPERNPWAAIPGGTLIERGHMPRPQPGDPGIFSLASADRIEELVTGAGFEAPEIAEVDFSWRFAQFDDYWGFLNELAGGTAIVIRGLDDDERGAVKDVILERATSCEAEGGYAMPAVALNVTTS